MPELKARTEFRYLDPAALQRVREIRAADPEAIDRALQARTRRELLGPDGRLFIVAADHPARGSLGVGGDPAAMADRSDLLDRLALALSRPGVDGVLATADIVDDLALLGALEGKIVVGSMNRGGLAGSRFELDDRFTGYDIAGIKRARLDFAKTLLRVNLSDPGTLSTLVANTRAVNEAADAQLPIMLEPFLNVWDGERVRNVLTAEATIKALSIAAGLGRSSAYTWMKLPVVDEMEKVMAATTLPTLLLGGERSEDPDATFATWERALALPGVRGLTVGRSLLYPADDDVERAVDTAARLVHG
ncbi:Cgl0159 family (beta/alpha)8-fold protein [Sediminivirga luteola]|uniref:Cgl0159-like domain-containing protein n=1 Tax=Sediminivirga luteola TaxID=1774748 RepID=A0A8J2U1A2_9MICO|nr:deoxyribose-phosphate aldolase [Sediminivirga luteola]MCI2266078.1 deoxyribose-phosphate aldolase [Sediminivirga luteola]GGA27589.1 hypothetical protein GCM10011333_32940 [Sediminivirga luteola]